MKKAKETPTRGVNDLAEMRLYTLAELEPVLGVSQTTLKKYVKTGQLTAVKIAGKWRVSAETLKAFITRNV